MSVVQYNTGNVPTYRFYLTWNTITYEVFPLGFPSTTIVTDRAEKQVFYRTNFQGKLLFGTNSNVYDEHGVLQNRKDDWTLLWTIEQYDPCETLYLTILKIVEDFPVTYFEGHFSTTNGFFDLDKCTFEVIPFALDDYTTLLEDADLQYNILDIVTEVTTTAYIEGIYNVAYTHNRWLMDVIEYLAGDATAGISPGTTVSSEFFTDATNYVTLNDNRLLYVTIAQKSDIKFPTSTTPAEVAMLSWNELMDILWGMFQVCWNYNPITDVINIEHISWFTHGAGIDLRTQLLATSSNKYEYAKEVMPKYEKFSMMEADETNFIGTPIHYEPACINQDPKSNTLNVASLNVTTDLEYIINTPDSIGDEGFVLLCNYLDGADYYVQSTNGKQVQTSVRLNMDFSWANLQMSYWRHNRIMLNGWLDNAYMPFVSVQKTIRQEISAILCDELDDFDYSDEITTELGETYFESEKGVIKTAIVKPTGETNFTLLYGKPDNNNPGVATAKYVRVIQEATNLFVTLTEDADVQVDVVVELTDCAGLNPTTETITIAIGDRYGSLNILHKLIVSVTTVSGTWLLSFEQDLTYVCA